jgi:hypothetical protein
VDIVAGQIRNRICLRPNTATRDKVVKLAIHTKDKARVQQRWLSQFEKLHVFPAHRVYEISLNSDKHPHMKIQAN